MVTHKLKTWPVFYDAVARGEKTFEVRKDDRGFQKGDKLVLIRTREDDVSEIEYSYPSCKPKYTMEFIVGHVLHGGQFGIEPGWCVMSLLPVPTV